MKVYYKENARKTILKKGYTLKSFAKKINITTQALGKQLKREYGIDPKRTNEILEVLGVKYDEIFDIKE